MTRSVRDSSPLDLSSYPALNVDGLERRANYRVIAFREDMLHVLEKREAAAIIFQILFRWQEYLRDKALEEIEQRHNRGLPPLRPTEIEERLWVYMSYARFVRESGGAVSYNTVIRTLAYLVDKKVIEQRANQNPRTAEYADYEYRINHQVVKRLLKGLPEFPGYSSKKGTSGQTTNAAQTDTSSDVTACTMGTAVAPSAQTDEPSAQTGTPSALLGTEDSPSGDAIQNILQDSPQESPQQQEASNQASDPEAAATSISQLGPLSPEEIALVLAHRCQTVFQTTSEPTSTVTTTSLDEDHPQPSPDDASEPPEVALSAEALVALVERKRAMRYDAQAHQHQLVAARTLLDLKLPLNLDQIERLYDACDDDWWKAHYGDLHLTHLVERDKHGQLRITRLLARLQASERKAARPATIFPPSAQISGDPMIGVSGRPIFHSSGQPLKVLPPAHSPHRRSTIAALGG